jgi:hypothetical protein
MEEDDGDDNATYYTADTTPYNALNSENQQPVYDLAGGGGKQKQNSVYVTQAGNDTDA